MGPCTVQESEHQHEDAERARDEPDEHPTRDGEHDEERQQPQVVVRRVHLVAEQERPDDCTADRHRVELATHCNQRDRNHSRDDGKR